MPQLAELWQAWGQVMAAEGLGGLARLGFEHPERGALGALAIGLLLLRAWRRGPLTAETPSAPVDEVAGRPERGTDLAWLLSLALRSGVLLGVCGAIAAPFLSLPERVAGGSGIDLIVALDASGSMEALDGQLAGRRVPRLELAKRAVAALVRQRPRDRIGLVVFGDQAFTQCPLTLDHALVLRALDRVEARVAGDATAIGDAVGLAVRRLSADDARPDTPRVIVLLTDGRHNAGRIAPDVAARLAAQRGVRTHAVGIGSERAVPFIDRSGERGEPQLRFERIDLDRATLRQLAQGTGGRFFEVERPEEVAGVADEIHALEATPLPVELGERRVPLRSSLLLGALLLVALDGAAQFGWLRRLP